jgi:hypothetical protein
MMGLKPILVDGLRGKFHCVGRSLGRRLAPSSPRPTPKAEARDLLGFDQRRHCTVNMEWSFPCQLAPNAVVSPHRPVATIDKQCRLSVTRGQ